MILYACIFALIAFSIYSISSYATEGLVSKRVRSKRYDDDSELIQMDFNVLMRLGQAGNAEAQNALGVRFGLGKGVAQDAKAAAQWYLRAALQGLAVAQVNLAYMYLHGEGVICNSDLAFRWAQKSAAQGHACGQSFLGYMYGTGTGVAMDERAAENCYLLAAKQGDREAQRTVIMRYSTTVTAPSALDRGVMWLHKIKDDVVARKAKKGY